MFVDLYFAAFERTMARLVERFQQAPDQYIHQEDLLAGAFVLLQEQSALHKLYPTRDGRLTGLVHRHYGPILSFPDGLTSANESDISHPLALLDPRFVRSYPFEVVANINGRGRRVFQALPAADRDALRPPLLATAHLLLMDNVCCSSLETLHNAFMALVRAEPDAQRQYMVVLIRHWNLEQQIAQVLERMERWADNHGQISAVVVQAYRDDVGRVCGGRYLNMWNHMAPLPPLDTPSPVSSRASLVYSPT
jgi:hypothetical protein